jgi:hypothetical protein
MKYWNFGNHLLRVMQLEHTALCGCRVDVEGLVTLTMKKKKRKRRRKERSTIPGTNSTMRVRSGYGRIRKESYPHTLFQVFTVEKEMSQREKEVTEKKQVT